MQIVRWLVMAVIGAVVSGEPAAVPIRVAAASDLQAVLPAIAAQFEQSTGRPVALTFGSSGNFFTQIQNGAPFDVFLSADVDYPRRLEQGGLAARGTLTEYAIGRIVLWTPRHASMIDIQRGLAVLADDKVRRIAIANPAHAPYGRAAVAALRHEGLYDRVQSKLVLGENISQAAQFVQSGNAEVGMLAMSLALTPALKSTGAYAEIPAALHPPIEQAAVVIAASRQQAIAKQFVDALVQPAAARLFESFGFAPPAPAKTKR